jgi:hypothetical protein
MAMKSRRGIRSILSRTGKTSYSHLREDENGALAVVGTTTTITTTLDANAQTTTTTALSSDVEPRPVTVSVTTSIAATHELEYVNGIHNTKKFHNDNIIALCASSSMNKNIGIGIGIGIDTTVQEEKEEEKISEEYNNISSSSSSDVLETTRKAAIELIQNASSVVSRTFASTGNTTDAIEEEKEEEKTDDGPDAGDATTTQCSTNSFETQTEELRKKVVDQAYRCGNGLVETSRECVDTTHKAAHNLVEASTSTGKGIMESTEACSQAAITDLCSSPMLEQTSENFESACEEVQEFLVEHWALLKDHITIMTKYSKQKLCPNDSNGCIENMHSTDEGAVSNVSIEIQMKATTE